LPEQIQDAIHLGKFEQGKGYELSRLSNQDLMTEFFNKITNPAHQNGWTIAKIKEEIDEILKKEEEKTLQKKKIRTKILENTKKNLKEKKKDRNEVLQKFIDLSKKIKTDLEKKLEHTEELDNPNTIHKVLKKTIKQEDKAVEKGWKEKQKQIENIQKRINSINALFDQVEELHISVCPYCGAGIDIETLKEEEQKLREKIEDLENQQLTINQNLKEFQKYDSDFKNLKNFIKKKNSEVARYLQDIVQSRKELCDLEGTKLFKVE